MEEFKLNLNKHAGNKNIIISIIFSKLKNFLIKNNKEDIIGFIKYIKINDDNVYIKTQKPIINAELKIFEGEIKNMIKDIFGNFGILYKEFNLYFK